MLLTWMFFPCGVISAQSDSSFINIKKIQYDQRTDLQPVHFDQKQLQDYKKDQDFNYRERPNPENWWKRFTAWLANIWNSFWRSVFGSIQAGGWLKTLLEIGKYLLVAGVIFLIAWLFIRLNPGNALLKPKNPPEVLLSEDEKIIRENDIPTLIEKALRERDYRLAVRYYYLLILKKLKDKNLIEYQFEKTNQEYESEIQDRKLSEQFRRVTRLYDFIWYGDFPMNQNQFVLAKSQFERIQEKLKNTPDE